MWCWERVGVCNSLGAQSHPQASHTGFTDGQRANSETHGRQLRAAITCVAQFQVFVCLVGGGCNKVSKKTSHRHKDWFWLLASEFSCQGSVSFRTGARMSEGKKKPFTSGSHKTEKRHRTWSSYTLLGPYTLLSNTSSNTIKLYPLLLNPPMMLVLMTLLFPQRPTSERFCTGSCPCWDDKVANTHRGWSQDLDTAAFSFHFFWGSRCLQRPGRSEVSLLRLFLFLRWESYTATQAGLKLTVETSWASNLWWCPCLHFLELRLQIGVSTTS